MWRKEEAEDRAVGRAEPPQERERDVAAAGSGARATIGRSITIRGDVTGEEDLVIEGRVEGSVDLKQHSVTIGPQGEVKADIKGRVVTVEGRVEGDLHADEQVILRGTARVQGDISAPRVMLEDGAHFRGGVDMVEPGHGRPGRPAATAAGRTEAGRTEAGGASAASPAPGARASAEKGAEATGSP
jgi:cytoskeletal protein CcmA (bactofilin family)